MVRKSTLLGAVSLVLVAAACSNEVPAGPSSPRPGTIGLTAGREKETESETEADDNDEAFSYAVIGDMPYGQGKFDSLPQLISLINNDPAVIRVIHIGDIKAGSNSDCNDTYFGNIKALFDTFQDPLVYTPGDNEWTDCHKFKKNNGTYTPTERLQAVRNRFFPVAGQTLGVHSRHVFSQATDPANSAYVENVRWTRGGVIFATVNITGSFNDLAPWSATPTPWASTPADMPANWVSYPSQAAELAARAQANAAWIERAFDLATKRHARGLVLAFQADMWDPAELVKDPVTFRAGYGALVQQIGTRAAQFGRPVLILEGDSHVWNVDAPFTPSSALFGTYLNSPVATNVTRLVVDGSSSPTSYTRLTINPGKKSQLFTLTRVPLVPGF